MKSMRSLDQSLRQATRNRLGFKFYTGGVQGDEKDVLRKIRNGQLQGGGFTGYGLGSIVPEVRVLELPFMFEDLREIDFVRGRMDSLFACMFERKGFILLGWTDVGFIYIFSNSPIRTPGDLQKVKMWIWSGDPLAALFFKAFRVSPIPLAVPDVLTSLQMGLIDAVYASPLACLAVQWYSRVKYMTNVPVTHGLGAVLVSKRVLKGSSLGDIEKLLSLSREHLRELNEKTRIQNLEAIEVLQKEGIKIISVDERTKKAFFATGKGAWGEGTVKLYPKSLLDQARSILEGYRANDYEAPKKTNEE